MQMLVLVVLLVASVAGDVFLHNPRGSNNRLKGEGTNVGNNKRLFNSRNIAKGGYNSGLKNGNMYYFVGSELPIEFSVAQGCGSNTVGGAENSHHCDIVLQYMCSDEVRDGSEENTVPENMDTYNEATERLGYKYGMHENYHYYQACKKRSRNLGLFTADRDLTGNKATYTRQNAKGQRYGFECPEERDYYPYPHPTPWRDIAIITDDVSRCDMYKEESQNIKGRGFCEDAQFSTEDECPNGQWTNLQPWANLYPDLKAPECVEGDWTRENMFSNTVTGYFMTYNWTLPNTPAHSCALRIRYNVTTADFPGWTTDYTKNTQVNETDSIARSQDFKGGVVQTQPVVKCCEEDSPICECGLYHLPQNAAGAVYQDRSHRFSIVKRPVGVKNKIHNLNVRGKRGNIVQTYPAVEYDFTPNVLHCKVGEWVHIQMTGSDTNPNGNDGQGINGSDRNNFVQIETLQHNYPISEEYQSLVPLRENELRLAYLDQTRNPNSCAKILELQDDDDENIRNCAVMNPNPPYYDGGLQACTVPGMFYYMSSRNNNFSNRSQKGTLVVHPCTDGDEDCSNNDVLPLDSQGNMCITCTEDADGNSIDFSSATVLASSSFVLIALLVF